LKLRKKCSFFQLGNCLTFSGGAISFQQSPKRAMLTTDEHLMDNAKGNNHKEGDKP